MCNQEPLTTTVDGGREGAKLMTTTEMQRTLAPSIGNSSFPRQSSKRDTQYIFIFFDCFCSHNRAPAQPCAIDIIFVFHKSSGRI